MKTASQSDEQLMQRLRKGEMEPLGELYLRYAPLVKSAIGRMFPYSDFDDREDVCQEVFITLSETASRYTEMASFKSWIYGIAVRKSLSARRTAWLRKLFLGHLKSHRVSPPNQLGRTRDELEIKDEVNTALAKLSRGQRDAVLLHVEGFSGEEIGQMLGVKPKTVWTRIHRARQILLTSSIETEQQLECRSES